MLNTRNALHEKIWEKRERETVTTNISINITISHQLMLMLMTINTKNSTLIYGRDLWKWHYSARLLDSIHWDNKRLPYWWWKRREWASKQKKWQNQNPNRYCIDFGFGFSFGKAVVYIHNMYVCRCRQDLSHRISFNFIWFTSMLIWISIVSIHTECFAHCHRQFGAHWVMPASVDVIEYWIC